MWTNLLRWSYAKALLERKPAPPSATERAKGPNPHSTIIDLSRDNAWIFQICYQHDTVSRNIQALCCGGFYFINIYVLNFYQKVKSKLTGAPPGIPVRILTKQNRGDRK